MLVGGGTSWVAWDACHELIVIVENVDTTLRFCCTAHTTWYTTAGAGDEGDLAGTAEELGAVPDLLARSGSKVDLSPRSKVRSRTTLALKPDWRDGAKLLDDWPSVPISGKLAACLQQASMQCVRLDEQLITGDSPQRIDVKGGGRGRGEGGSRGSSGEEGEVVLGVSGLSGESQAGAGGGRGIFGALRSACAPAKRSACAPGTGV